HVAPPGVLDVALELDAQRAEVPAAGKTAVDLARLKGEPAPFGQVHDLVHGHFSHVDEGIDLARDFGKANFATLRAATRTEAGATPAAARSAGPNAAGERGEAPAGAG